MALAGRSVSDVLQNIIRNVQEIVRSEVRLAKSEIREEAGRIKSTALLLGAGAIAAVFSLLFFLLTMVYGLSAVMPNWAAALIVGVALAAVAGMILTTGLSRLKLIYPSLESADLPAKESVQ